MNRRCALVAAWVVAMALGAGCERQSPEQADPSMAPASSAVPMTVGARPEPNTLADQAAVSAAINQASEQAVAAAAAAKAPPAAAVTPEAPATPAAGAEPPLAVKAREAVAMLRAGRFEDLHKRFEARQAKDLDTQTLSNAWDAFTKSLGEYKDMPAPEILEKGDDNSLNNTPVIATIEFTKGNLEVTMHFTDGGQIAKLQMQPVDPNKKREERAKEKVAEGPAPVPAGLAANLLTRAQETLKLMQAERFENAYQMTSPSLQKAMTLEQLGQSWTMATGALGAPTGIEGAAVGERIGKDIPVMAVCKYEKGSLNVLISFDETARISGLRIAPGSAAPAAPAEAKPADEPTPAAPGSAKPASAAPAEGAPAAGGVQSTLNTIYQRLGAKEAPPSR